MATASAALTEGNPKRRSEPKRAWEGEQVLCSEDYWLWRLKKVDFCPTAHGPRRPSAVWQPSREVERLFGKVDALLPVLDVDCPRALADALGIRGELTPSAFTLDDAQVLLNRLEIQSSRAEDSRRVLRDVRSACRHLVELLVGHQPHEKLEKARLPAMRDGTLIWLPASQVFFAERRRYDLLHVPTFLLEAEPRARAPLQACFGVRVLEESLCREPQVGEPALGGTDLDCFRSMVWERGPAILARLAAERQDERYAAEDTRLLRALLRGLLPVNRLAVRTTLDGQPVGPADYEVTGTFVDRANPGCAFVQWGSHPWPSSPEEEERLAEAICQVFGTNWYEPFLAIVHATDKESRLRILLRAGAPTDLDEFRRRLDSVVDYPVAPSGAPTSPTQPTPGNPPEAPIPHDPASPSSIIVPDQPLHPLWSVECLMVQGNPVTISSGSPAPHDDHGVHETGETGDGTGSHSATRTDLEALDQLGMSIALAFERGRLAHKGGGRVFDVSSPARIREAWAGLQHVFEHDLILHGVSTEWPGFDILALDSSGALDRMIELKSSGVAARVQDCTWNEWKSAGHPALRGRFFLYLVGNLRSDLQGQVPFVRTVQDPFGQLRSDVLVQTRIDRKVQLSVALFRQAEEEILKVTRHPGVVQPAYLPRDHE